MSLAQFDFVEITKNEFKRLLEFTNIPMVIHDTETVLHVNPAVVTILGATSIDDLVGKKIMDFITNEYKEIAKSRMLRAYQEKQPNDSLEESILSYNGNILKVSIKNVPVCYEGKTAVLAVFSEVDG